MVFWLFAVMTAVAFFTFFYNSQRGYATRALYSLVLVLIWGACAYHFY